MKSHKASWMINIINIILIIAIVYIGYLLTINTYEESNIKNEEIAIDRLSAVENNQNDISEEIIEEKTSRELKYMKQLQGYNVIAKLQIFKINLETDVLEKCTNESLKVSVTKFYGPNPNEIGNFCITGHNYVNKNMFSKLKKLSIGDEIKLTDGYDVTVTYKIYDILKVLPNETKDLSQKTNGIREITLITCTADSKQRIIVKAREI